MIHALMFGMLLPLIALSGQEDERTITTDMIFPTPEFLKLPLVSPLLSELREGESVEIRILTRHCGGGSTYLLDFKGPAPIHVAVRGWIWVRVEQGELPSLGEVILTKADALRVDRVLAFYRGGPKGVCTTTDEIAATWHLKSGTLSQAWIDSSCSRLNTDISLSPLTVAVRAWTEP